MDNKYLTLCGITKYIFVLLFLVWGCGEKNPTKSDEFQELIPLQKGNQWNYTVNSTDFIDSSRTVDTTITVILRILDEMQIEYDSDTIIVYKWWEIVYMREETKEPEFHRLVRNTEAGFCFYGTISEVDTFLFKTLYLKYPVNVGETWDYNVFETSLEGEVSIADTVLIECILPVKCIFFAG